MATERDFITPAGLTVLTTANVVANTISLDMFGNRPRAQSFPAFSQNFVMNPRLDSRFVFTRTSNATYTAANGNIVTATANTPRFDYDPVTLQCKGLLLEEPRTNLFVWSTPDANTWSGYGSDPVGGAPNLPIAIKTNAGRSPDGSNNASFLYWRGSSWQYQVVYPFQGNLNSNQTYTQSIFVKANTSPVEPTFYIAHYDTTDSGEVIQVFYYPANNTLTSAVNSANVYFTTTPQLQDYPDGWKRIYFSFRYTTGSFHGVQAKHSILGPITASGINTQGVYVWGAQLEAGAHPTSFIYTSGTQVSRAPEYAKISDLSAFKSSAMTVISKQCIFNYTSNINIDTNYCPVWELRTEPPNPNGSYDAFWLRCLPHSVPYQSCYYLQYTTGPTNQSSYAGFGYPITYPNGTPGQYISNSQYSTAVAVAQSNNIKFAVGNSGFSGIALDTANYVGPNTNLLTLGSDIFGYGTNGWIASFAVYPRALSNTEIINIASASLT